MWFKSRTLDDDVILSIIRFKGGTSLIVVYDIKPHVSLSKIGLESIMKVSRKWK